MSTNNFWAIFLFLFQCQLLLSQTKENIVKDSTQVEELGEVIISATRAQRQLSSLPLPAQIVLSKEIQATNSLRLADILNEQTGLLTVTPISGQGEGIQLQGLDSQYTLIMIDGAPLVGRSAGTLDVSRLSVGNIKQIEVIKGASSSLYGNEALGGVINIITKSPKNGFDANFNYRGGTNNVHDIGTNISYQKDKFSITSFINRYSSNGYDLDTSDALKTVDPFENYTISTKFTYNFTQKTSLLLSGRYYYQLQDNIVSNEISGESNLNEWNTVLKLNHKYNEKWSSYFEFYATQYRAEEFLNDGVGDTFSQSDFNQLFVRPEIRATYNPTNKHSFIGGLGITHEKLDRTDFFGTPQFNSPYIYLQYDGHPTNALNVILGARFDNHSEYASQFSPKAALRYKLNSKVAVKSSLGFGFKAPDFRQLYFDFTNTGIGYTVLGYNAVSVRIPQLEADGQLTSIVVPVTEFNEELKAENSISYNLGIDYKPINPLKININLFRNDIKNLIDTRVIARKTNGQNVFSYYNVAAVYTQGLEFNATYKLNEYTNISGGYQLLYAKDKDAAQKFKEGLVNRQIEENGTVVGFVTLDESDYFGLFNRSRHMANLKVFHTFPKWKMDANVRNTFRSNYGLFDTNGNTYLDGFDEFVEGYIICDFALNKTFYEDYKLGLGIDNLFNFTDPQNISNIAGRLFYGKLNINF